MGRRRMTNSEYLWAMVHGAFISAAIILGIYMAKPPISPNPPISTNAENHRNFEIVDTYSYENRTCSVIRYTTPSTSWEYFLDCRW